MGEAQVAATVRVAMMGGAGAMVVMLAGASVFGYVIGNMASLISELDMPSQRRKASERRPRARQRRAARTT